MSEMLNPVVRKLTPTPALVADDPLEQFLSGQLSERTRRAYYADLEHFFASIGIELKDVSLAVLQTITFEHVVAFRNQLASEGYKRSSINRKLSSLKSLFKMLVALGHIGKNPADSALVRGYKLDETLVGKALPNAVLSKLQQAIAEEENDLVRTRDAAIFHLLTFGGLRRSEVAGVAWEDISLEGVFHILRLPETKSGVTQEIKLQNVVLHHLELYKQQLEQAGLPTTGKVFISLSRNHSRGQPLTDQSVNHIVKKYARRTGLPQNVTAHMFRHTCCTLAIEGGAKPQQVQAHLRHKDLKTTMRYYENREKLLDNASDYIKVGMGS